MAMYQFTSTPNTGALRTSKVAAKIYEAAIAECVFVEHVGTMPFGTGMGSSVTIPGEANMTELSDYALSENARVPEGTHTVDGKVVTVREVGNSITWSRFAEDISTFDLRSSIQRAIKKDMKLFLDSRACYAFKQSNLKYTPTGAASASTATNGTAPTAALAGMNLYHLAAIRDLLFRTYKAPMVDGSYIGIFSTMSCSSIQNDPDFQQWHIYANPETMFNAEVGRARQVRVIETNHGGTTVGSAGLNDGIGTGSVLGEGVVFGENAVIMIESAPVGIKLGRDDDYGRLRSVAWYGQIEFSLQTDSVSAGRPRVIHVTST